MSTNLDCLVQRIRNSSEIEPLRQALASQPASPINRTGAFLDLQFDLSGATGIDITKANPTVIPNPGYGIFFTREGSASTARLDLDMGGRVSSWAPGQGFECPQFDQFAIRRNANSAQTGFARLLVLLSPAIRWQEETGVIPVASPSLSTINQLYNSASNNPTVTDGTLGVGLTGARGIRLTLDAGAGNTFNTGAGSIVFWYYQPDLALWGTGLSGVSIAIPNTGSRLFTISDVPVSIPYGRVFAEVRSATHSGGSGNIGGRLEVY